MTAAHPQLTLDLAHRAAVGAEDFLVSDSNAAAVALVDQWPQWPHWAAVVCGPAGSGKSHLAHVWQLKSGAAIERGANLSEAAVDRLAASRALVIEDVERGIASDRAFFHLLNLAREHKLSILVTTRTAPGALEIALPDLRSRLRALPLVEIAPPDEALIKAVAVKLFADRQLAIDPRVVNYIARHAERSLDMVARVIAAADQLALARRTAVTTQTIKEVLIGLGAGELPD
jgi:chromosomal replication initiation ATPase DnaA